MGLKEILKQEFSNPKDITLERYRATKFAFIISVFLFFINFYFVWANFYSGIFTNTLGISYLLLLLSIVFYVYFLIKKMLLEKIPKFLFIIIFILLFVLSIFLSLPIIIKWWLVWILELFWIL